MTIDEKFLIYWQGIPVGVVNKRTLDQQNAWGNLEEIRYLYGLRVQLFADMAAELDPKKIIALDRYANDLEFRLQTAWGFEKTATKHRFWNRPHCTCPKTDNEDAWGTEFCVIDGECPLHGTKARTDKKKKLKK